MLMFFLLMYNIHTHTKRCNFRYSDHIILLFSIGQLSENCFDFPLYCTSQVSILNYKQTKSGQGQRKVT